MTITMSIANNQLIRFTSFRKKKIFNQMKIDPFAFYINIQKLNKKKAANTY